MKHYKSIDIYILVFILAIFLGAVECKHCTYRYDNGSVRPFTCGAYEYCCGTACCRSRAISFYQIWYFWLMIILMLLLCSGGGWWYRFRYHSQFQNQQGHLAFPSTSIPASVRPHVYGARPFASSRSTQRAPPPPYPVQNASINPPQLSANAPPTTMLQTQAPAGPPPPYTGPPPSYAAATGKPPSP